MKKRCIKVRKSTNSKERMKYIKEKYMNSEGKEIYIERFIGKQTKCVLSDGYKNLSPMVNDITYDQEHKAFLVRDEYHDTYENGNGNHIANVYFYLDFSGNPIGLAYTDAFDGMFDVMTSYEDLAFKDQWFLGYASFKRNLGIRLGKKIQNRLTLYKDSAEKMLSVKK